MRLEDPYFDLQKYGDKAALIDGDSGRKFSYLDCYTFQKQMQVIFGAGRKLFFLFCNNSLEEVISYIALLNLEQTICLLDDRLDTAAKQRLISLYSPHYIINQDSGLIEGYERLEFPVPNLCVHQLIDDEKGPLLHPDLRLLLSSSGSTSTPKIIRLSKKNLISNTSSIVKHLEITSPQVAMIHLPMQFSFCLCFIDPHLNQGASLVLTKKSVIEPGFWAIMRDCRCTSFAGVPLTYQILDRINFEKLELPDLKVMIQGAGRLSQDLVAKFHQMMEEKGGRFYLTYGQTEAGRISYVPFNCLKDKKASVGIPIAPSKLTIENEELIFHSDNVMMGYAEGADDLAKADELQGHLHTGDLGREDEDHFFYITGRIKRIAKVYGLRINLDELERKISHLCYAVITSNDQKFFIHIHSSEAKYFSECVSFLAKNEKLHTSLFECKIVEDFPRTLTGKIDYRALELL